MNIFSKIKPRSVINQLLTIALGIVSVASVLMLLDTVKNPDITVDANSNCTNASSAVPVWNPFPLNLNDPNPQPNGLCSDIPMVSHWPLMAQNPRTRNYNAGDTVTVQLYYNNGAIQSGTNTKINSPRARLELTQVNATQYRLRGFLSGTSEGSGATITADSSQTQYGEDIIINIPNNTTLQPIRRQTSWFPQAALRKTAFDSGQNYELSLNIDNSITTTNPLLSQNGFQIYTPTPSSIASQQAPGLNAGFNDAGYFLIAWNVVANQSPVNNPPTVPGQEITIVRGNNGSFTEINGNDPDGDIPLTYTPNNLPSFCTYNATTRIISCTSNAQTPVRTTFTVTPTDSKGLSGNPATFIVNIIEPELNITKNCVKIGTTTPCNQSGLLPGADVTYTINITNNATAPANNSILEDDYDQTLIENIRNVTPSPASVDTNNGKINWNLGTIATGASVNITYNATIKSNANTGAVVKNTAVVSADGVTPKRAETEFTIGVQDPILSESDKVCFKKGTNTPCSSANLTIGQEVTYFVNVKNTGSGSATNVKLVDTYDKAKLTAITNIQPTGSHDTNAGTITWELGTINAGATKTVSFDARVAQGVTNGTIIVNTALITADKLPPQTVRVQFPVGVPITPQLERTGGFTIILILLGLTALGAGVYYLYKTNKLNYGFIPSRSSEIGQSHKPSPKNIIKKITRKK